MLSLEVPARQVGGLLVFADHADATQFYYAAPNPRLAVTSGRPMFDVFSYAVELAHSPLGGTTIPDELGAGFLTMGVDCRVDEAQRQRARTELATQLGADPATLGLNPIPYTAGTVSVIALDAASGAIPAGPVAAGRPTFVEHVVGSGTPSLLGDLRAIFSLSLSQQGVTFLQKLYEQGAAPVGVVYQLTFLGLRPAVQASIKADMTKVYHEFGGKAAVGYAPYVRAEVEKTLSDLHQRGVVDIQVTTTAAGEEGARLTQLALSLFQDKVIQELFKPSPTPPSLKIPAMPGQPPDLSIVSLSLRDRTESELRSIAFDFTVRSPEERTHAPQGFVTTLLTEDEVRARTHHVDLASPFFELLEVLVTGPSDDEFAALGLRAVTADVTYADEPPRSIVFRPGETGDKTYAAKRLGRASLAYTVDLEYEFTRSDGAVDGDAVVHRTGPRERTGRAFSIRPYDDLAVLDVEVDLGRVPADVRDVDVVLDAAGPDGFTARHQVRLPGPAGVPLPLDRRRWQVRTRPPGTGSYTATSTLTFDDGAVLALAPVESTERLFRVDAPFTATRSLLVQPSVTATDVTAITLELDYADGAYRRVLTRTFTPPAAPAGVPTGVPWPSTTVTWPILDVAKQEVRYRVTTAAGGVVDTTDWEPTTEPSIVVGDVGRRRRSVEVRLVGPPLAEAGVDGLLVRVGVAGTPDDTAQSVFFDPATPGPLTVSLPAEPGAAPGFRFQTTSFRADGTQRPSAWLDAPNPLLVLSTRTV